MMLLTFGPGIGGRAGDGNDGGAQGGRNGGRGGGGTPGGGAITKASCTVGMLADSTTTPRSEVARLVSIAMDVI